MKNPAKIIVALVVMGLTGLLVCSRIVTRYEKAFALTVNGDERSAVLLQFGPPSVREPQGKPFLRYATEGCSSPCFERLWWEHPLLKWIEAWSVTLDEKQRVIDKTHWAALR